MTALHRQPVALATVLLGGVLGTLARWGVSRALPARHGWPVGTLVANLVGALVLGWLLEHLARSGPDEGGRRTLRLLLGTGFCGAFTTMSSLDVETSLLASGHHAATALGYLVVSLVAGLACAALGVAVGNRTGRRGGSAA